MKNIKKFFSFSLFVGVFMLGVQTTFAATTTFTASQTIANVPIRTIPAIIFAGGVDGVEASVTITIPAGLAATADDADIEIDGVAIDLGAIALTPAEIATAIAGTDFSTGDSYDTNPYTVEADGDEVTFTRDDVGVSGNGALVVGDADYTTTNAISEVKATRTITVDSLPDEGVTLTIGTCIITFTDIPGLTDDEIDCGDDVAEIDRTKTGGDVDRSAAEIAEALRDLVNVSDALHGGLTVGGGGATASFTTTGAETSATSINTALSVPGSIMLDTVDTPGVVAVPADTNLIPAIVLAGGVDEEFATVTITIPFGLPEDASDTEIIIGGITIDFDTEAEMSAEEIAAFIADEEGDFFNGEDYTVEADGADLIFTWNIAGIVGNGALDIEDANYGGIAQVVTFTPTDVVKNKKFRTSINSSDYTHTTNSSSTIKTVVEGLQPLVDGNSAVGCTEDDIKITCTASTPGTAFTYSSSVSNVSSGSGGGGGFSTPPVVPGTPPVVCPPGHLFNMNTGERCSTSSGQVFCPPGHMFSAATGDRCTAVSDSSAPGASGYTFGSALIRQGSRGEECRAWQMFFNAKRNAGLAVDGNCGPLTMAAARAWQSASGLVADGLLGPASRAKAMMQ